jgi:hypothetical protein
MRDVREEAGRRVTEWPPQIRIPLGRGELASGCGAWMPWMGCEAKMLSSPRSWEVWTS